MDRADPRYTNPLDPPYAKVVAAERRRYWELIRRMTDGTLMVALDNSHLRAHSVLDEPALQRIARRSGSVVHYRMVRRECLNRMKRGNR